MIRHFYAGSSLVIEDCPTCRRKVGVVQFTDEDESPVAVILAEDVTKVRPRRIRMQVFPCGCHVGHVQMNQELGRTPSITFWGTTELRELDALPTTKETA